MASNTFETLVNKVLKDSQVMKPMSFEEAWNFCEDINIPIVEITKEEKDLLLEGIIEDNNYDNIHLVTEETV